MGRDVLILAGGLGTRLQNVVSDVPKPMAPIHNKPFLEYLLQYCNKYNATHIFISVFHLKEKIQNYFGHEFCGIPIDYIEEEEPLGTGGAIQMAIQKQRMTEPFYIMNGDTFFDINLPQMKRDHESAHKNFSMALYWQKNNVERYGKVKLQNNKIHDFLDKGTKEPGYINGGIYYLNPSVLSQYKLPEKFSFETDFVQKYVKEILIHPYIKDSDNYFIDIGIPEDYERAMKELK